MPEGPDAPLEDSPRPPLGADLIRRVLEGDDRAWHDLLEQVTPLVARHVRIHLRRAGDRDDVIQEVLTRIFLNIRSIRDGASLERWVSRIAINTCHDWLRKMKARPAVLWSDLDPGEAAVLSKSLVGPLDSPDRERSALFELLDKLLGTLKPREQIVIRLLDLEGHSVQDVCALTGWGASKVKVTAMRARKKLAAQLRRLEETPPRPPHVMNEEPENSWKELTKAARRAPSTSATSGAAPPVKEIRQRVMEVVRAMRWRRISLLLALLAGLAWLLVSLLGPPEEQAPTLIPFPADVPQDPKTP